MVHGVPAVDLSPPSETYITLPSFGKVLLRPKRGAVDASESQAKRKVISETQKRPGEVLEDQPETRSSFTNAAMNEEKARMSMKRSAEGDWPQDASEDVDVSLMQTLEDAEEQTLHMTSLDYCLPMITCEEPVDLSFLDSERARNISDAIGCSRVGEARHLLDERLNQCMMAELCG